MKKAGKAETDKTKTKKSLYMKPTGYPQNI